MEQSGEDPLETLLLDSAARGRRGWRFVLPVVVLVALLVAALGWYWSREPAAVDPMALVAAADAQAVQVPVSGAASVLTLTAIAGTLLDKPGGYLANDVLPPGVLLDNMPAFEFGALTHVRDFSRALRRDFSRSQSQALEDRDLVRAEPHFHFDSNSWLSPSSEDEYRAGIADIESYYLRLRQPVLPDAYFFARADNLARWLEDVNARLDSYSQRLTAAIATDQARTPWRAIDDVFFEARGYCWALLAQLRAAQIDFAPVLGDKQAEQSLAQVVRELTGTQAAVWSPLILNGREYGVLANHSLMMGGYVARANGGIYQLRGVLVGP